MLMQDLRFALRSLRKNLGFTVVAVLTLGLGVGANTAIFTLVNSVILRPLPYPEADRLVALWHRYERVGLLQASVSPPNYVDYTNELQFFDRLAAYTGQSVTLTGDGQPFRMEGMLVTLTLFDVLGITPMLGRPFGPADELPGAQRVVILNNALWKSRFGADDAIIGKTLILDDESQQVVGVMPPGFAFRNAPDIYLPLAFTPAQLSDNSRGSEFLSVVGRLRDGVEMETANAGMARVAARIDEQYGRGGFTIFLRPLHEEIVGGDIRPALYVLLTAVGFVLLIACVNVANLLFAKAEARQREVAVRTALGASKWRVVRQFITESLVLGLVGGAVGLLIAFWGVNALVNLPNVDIPRASEVRIDAAVLGFSMAVSLFTGLLFGLGPALGVARSAPLDCLHEGARRTFGDLKGSKLRNGLVVSEVSLALVLLIGAGLMLKSFSKLSVVDPGFDADNVLSFRVNLPDSRYGENVQRAAFFRQALERVRSLPGVTHAGAIVPVPMSGENWSGSFMVEGTVYDESTPVPNTKMRYVTPGYFETMAIALLQGRSFDDLDTETNARVAIVDETFARRYIASGDPVGQRVGFPSNWATIVGVVADVQDVQLGGDINGHIYWAHAQTPISFMALMIRTETAPAGLTGAVVREIQAIDPAQAPYDFQTMAQRVSSTISSSRINAMLLAIFGTVALLLAAIGIYGVLAYSVSQRTNEIGVRTALGAQPGDVVRMVVRQGITPAVVGLVLGLGVSLALTRVLQGLLYGVSTTDLWVYSAVSVGLLGVSFLACYLPALRATRVAPVEALRYE